MVVAVAGFVVSSCGGATDTADGFVLSQEEIDLVIDSAGPSQAPFLEDRVITPAERERAYLNFVECASQRGVEVFGWSLNPHGGDSFNTRLLSGSPAFGEDSTGEDADHGAGEGATKQPATIEDEVVDVCRGEHYTAVGVLHEYLNRRTGSEVQEFEAQIAECMRDRSVDVPSGADFDQMRDIDRDTANRCYVEIDG